MRCCRSLNPGTRREITIASQTAARSLSQVALLVRDYDRSDYEHMKSHGIRFFEEPRHEAYGTVVVFLDLYGNKWDLIGPVTPA